MSDLVESFDVEAQECLLEKEAEAEAERGGNNIYARKSLVKIILLIRSTELFKLGANYNSLTNSHQDPEDNLAALEDISIVDHDQHNIELQEVIQGKNINHIVKNKNLEELTDFGGVRVVAEALNTDLINGLPIRPSHDTVSLRKPSRLRRFVVNILEACNSITILLLVCSAVLSLGFGIEEEGLQMGWFNGGVLMLTIALILLGTSIRKCWEDSCNWETKLGRGLRVRVVRGGDVHSVSDVDLEVGDVAVLKKGDQVPADGLFISASGQGLELDEGLINPTSIDEANPFLFYGSRVINGEARMLITATAADTAWGEMMTMSSPAKSNCKFETYLHHLNSCVQIAGLLISILILIVLFLRYKAGKLDQERTYRPDPRGEPTQVRTILDAIKGIITGSAAKARVLTTLLSVSLLGLVEGIPFSIAIAAIIWSSKTHLGGRASETDYFTFVKMASVTTIIVDELGGMAEHSGEIDTFFIGEDVVSESSAVGSCVLDRICDGIGTMLLLPPDEQEPRLLVHAAWAEQKLGLKTDEFMNAQCQRKRYSGHNPLLEPCRVLMEREIIGSYERYLHCKGPPQDILSMCSHHYDIQGRIWEMDEEKNGKLEEVVRQMLAQPSAQVVAYAFKTIQDFDDDESFEPNRLTLVAMLSMKETNTEDTTRAISTLKESGIKTVLATSIDNINALKTTALECGLLPKDGSDHDQLVLTAEEFKSWSQEDRVNKVESITILANCLPSHKSLLVGSLREKGHTVALVGQTTADAPALKQADVGITRGSWSSQVARECCEITIRRGNCLAFLAQIIHNGRCFQENIRKFIQLQLILAISSSLINFIAVVIWGDAPITAVQLFWLNLVVGLVGGLPLLTGPPTNVYKSSAKLITKAMWRNIAIQVSYQTSMFVTLQHRGQAVLGDGVKTFIYNGFFMCQMFNKLTAREPERKNIFRGLFGKYHWWFWVGVVVFVICQVVFAVAEEVLTGSGLTYRLWGGCILIALLSWVFDLVGKIASNCISTWINHSL